MNILKDSSYYQVLLKEGLEQGRKEGMEIGLKEGIEKGIEKGRIKEAREILFRLGRLRFGRLDRASRSAIQAIDDQERLDRMIDLILTATSWRDLLAESEIGHAAR